jgi:putative membrane protein
LAKFTHPDVTPVGEVSVNVVSYGVILTRAPLLVPLQQFLSALVVRFVQHRNKPLQALSQPFLLIWSVGLLGSFAAWLIGPWLMVAVLGDAYVISGRSLALFTLGATCTASLMITGAAAMSIDKHQYYLWGWATATLVGICFLASPLSLENGAWLALCIGPLCGLVVHMVGIFTARTNSSSLSTSVA